MNNLLILRIPAFACVIILFFHSFYFLGAKRTFILFILGFFMFFLFAKSEQRQPEYIVSHPVKFYGVPVLLPAGWIFTTYCSFYMSTSILALFPRKRESVFPVLAFSLVCVACIALAMEVAGTNAGWWKWNLKPGEKGPLAMIGWIHHTLIIYPWFLVLFCTKYRHWHILKKAAGIGAYFLLALALPVSTNPFFGALLVIAVVYLAVKADALKMDDTFNFR